MTVEPTPLFTGRLATKSGDNFLYRLYPDRFMFDREYPSKVATNSFTIWRSDARNSHSESLGGVRMIWASMRDCLPLQFDYMLMVDEKTDNVFGVFISEYLPEKAAPVGDAKDSGNPKDKLGNAKVDPSLVPPSATLYLAAGFADGAVKYGPYNWRDNKVKARVYIAAAMRHIQQYLDGENVDPESKVPHVGHAMACLAIIADATETGNLIDDRPTPGAAGDLIRRYKQDTKFTT